MASERCQGPEKGLIMIERDAALQPVRVEAWVLRHAIATPVRTSFGVMHDRPAVFVRVQDADGWEGWGEVWCNFPACGAEHRARLVETIMAPLLSGRRFEGPVDAFRYLTQETAVLAIQCAEPGPIAQAIAGVDQALWDLVARRRGQPLWRVLGGHSDEVGVYASGINPDGACDTVERMAGQGYTAFKLKVGFGAERDLANVRNVRDLLGGSAMLMADANQAWDLETAVDMARQLELCGLSWLEEPLRANRPVSEWMSLAGRCAVALAAGENLVGDAAFDEMIASGALAVVQPDVAKWGGISGCVLLARRIHAAGLRYCPHYLGGGIGLLHSAHLLAAVGGSGLLEVDVNDNPLRTRLCGPLGDVRNGRAALGLAPGIGVVPELSSLRALCDQG